MADYCNRCGLPHDGKCLRDNAFREWTNEDVEAYKKHEDERLSKGLCPYSGLPLTKHGDGAQGLLSCRVCDCFGFDPGHVRKPRKYD